MVDFANIAISGASQFGGMFLEDRMDRRNRNQGYDYEQRMRAEDWAREDRNWERSVAQEEKVSLREYERQKEFAQNGLRWRVDEAKMAGLHPLAAIGAGGSMYSPSIGGIGGGSSGAGRYGSGGSSSRAGEYLSRFGQDVQRAMRAGMTKEERELQALNTALLQSQIAETDARAGYYNSMAMKNAQQDVQSSPFPKTVGPGQVTVQPDQMISRSVKDSSQTAGEGHPFWKNYEIIPGLTVDIPYSQEGPAEGMEGTGALVSTLLRNLLYRPAKYIYNKAYNAGYAWEKRRRQSKYKAWESIPSH